MRAMARTTIAWMMLSLGCTVDAGGRAGFTGEVAESTADAGEGSGMPIDAESSGAGEGSTGEPADSSADPAAELIEEAKQEFPTYLDLHEKVVTRTCSPNGGVCHNEKEYPDLHTPQTMLSMLGAPCNLAEADPLNLFDGCEPPGDELVFTTGSNTTYI